MARVAQVLLLVAVLVSLGWLVYDFGPEPFVAAVTAFVGLITLRVSSERHRPKPPGRAAEATRLAVLPFHNITDETGKEYFADGLAEELISVLSRISGLEVIARSSSSGYRDVDRRIASIGRELHVGAVLEGSVRSVGEHLRIAVRLVDVSTESHLWSGDYDRRSEEVFAVQRDIATHVARSLEVTILGTEANRLQHAPTGDLEAYDLYLLGRHALNTRSAEGLLRSLERFRSAVDKDPDFAAAYAGLADAYVLASIGYASIPVDESMREARLASERALAAQPTLSDAHTSRGWVLMNADWDWAGAEAAFERAVALNSSDVRAYQWWAQSKSYQRQFEAAIPLAQRAQALDPRSPLVTTETGWPFFYLSRFEEALVQYERAIELDVGFALAHFNVGNVLEAQGRVDEALTRYEHAAGLAAGAPMYAAFVARAKALLGRLDEAEATLHGVIEAAEGGAPLSVYVAHVLEGLGRSDEALSWLERAAARRESILLAIGTVWLPFDGLRGLERYEAIAGALPVE